MNTPAFEGGLPVVAVSEVGGPGQGAAFEENETFVNTPDKGETNLALRILLRIIHDSFIKTLFVPNLDTGSFFLARGYKAEMISPPTPPPTNAGPNRFRIHFTPLPAKQILHSSQLVVAASWGFPSAHQSLHRSANLCFMPKIMG